MRYIIPALFIGTALFATGCSGVAREGAYILTKQAAAVETETVVSRLARETIHPIVYEPRLPMVRPTQGVPHPNPVTSGLPSFPDMADMYVIRPEPVYEPRFPAEVLEVAAYKKRALAIYAEDKFKRSKYYRYTKNGTKRTISFTKHLHKGEYPVRDLYNELITEGMDVSVCYNIGSDGTTSFTITASAEGHAEAEFTFDADDGFDVQAAIPQGGDEADAILTVARKGSLINGDSNDTMCKLTTSFCYPLSASGITVESPDGTRSVSFSAVNFRL